MRDKPKKPYLSYTGFSTYQKCPQQYYHNYILRARPEVEDARNTLNGNALHNLMEEYILLGEDNPRWMPDHAEVFFDRQLKKEKLVVWRNDKDEEFLRARLQKWAHSLADLFIEYELKPGDLQSELKIDSDVTMNGITVRLGGRIDVIKRRNDGRYIFFDLKGSENRQVMQLDQIAWYAMLLGIYLGDHNEPVAGGYILPGFNELKMYKVSVSDKKRLWLRIEKTFRDIEAEIWTPKPTGQMCYWCPFKTACPVQVDSLKAVDGTLHLG